jgi:hypothetical protein
MQSDIFFGLCRAAMGIGLLVWAYIVLPWYVVWLGSVALMVLVNYINDKP